MKKYLSLICSILLILLFLYAAYYKISSIKEFKYQLNESPILHSYGTLVAWLVPIVEIGIAFCLVFRKTRLLGLYGSFILLLLFTTYIYVLLHFSDRLPF